MRLKVSIVAAFAIMLAAFVFAPVANAQGPAIPAACDPFPGTALMDQNGDGSLDAVDLNAEIDVLFFNSKEWFIGCSDHNGDGSADAVDLNALIDLLFFNGPLPTVPRTVTLSGQLADGRWYLMNDPLVQYRFGNGTVGVFNVGVDLAYMELSDCPKTCSLYIPKGLHIEGDPSLANPSAIVVRRSGYVHAVGTSTDPVVFTSSNAPGARARGDWGGMVINGCACNNNDGNPISDWVVETEGGNAGIGGGTIDDDNSGCYKYLRVEFAGRTFFQDSELNGITVTSVGSGTTFEYIQINQNFDDGIEWFGGTVDVHHAVVSGVGDDGYDSDFGARWRGQYLIVIQDPDLGPTSDNHNGFEWDNQPGAPFTWMPRMNPTVYNVTVIGAACDLVLARQNGAHIRRGADADIHNTVFTKFRRALEYDESTAWDMVLEDGPGCTHTSSVAANPDARIVIQNTIFYDIQDSSGNSSVTAERPYLQDVTNDCTFGCGNPEIFTQVTDFTMPLDFRPIAGDPQGIGINAAGSVPPVDGFFDANGANFKGAVQENDPTPWYEGWTDFSQD